MDNIKKKWSETQLHWDDKEIIQSQKFPKSIIFNWRKMTLILHFLCKEKSYSSDNTTVIVDIGCGAGKFCDGLDFPLYYMGIDPSDKMLSYASIDYNKQFIRGVGEQLPLKSGIADIVLYKSVLDQCYDPSLAISESRRVLKAGGWLLISLSNRDSYYAIFRRLRNRLRGNKSDHFFQESHQFYFDMNEVKLMLKKEKFGIVYQIPFGYFIFPRSLEKAIPDRLLTRLIDISDRVGSFIFPGKCGGFILVGKC